MHFDRCLYDGTSTTVSNIFFFFFNDTATTEIYTLSLHDALPISSRPGTAPQRRPRRRRERPRSRATRSEEHTSELQSRSDLVCRLLLEKKKNKIKSGILYCLFRYE